MYFKFSILSNNQLIVADRAISSNIKILQEWKTDIHYVLHTNPRSFIA